jgi:hypothetical protein
MGNKEAKMIKTPSYKEAEVILREFQPRNENYLRFLVADFYGSDVATAAEYSDLRRKGRAIYNLAVKIDGYGEQHGRGLTPSKVNSLEKGALEPSTQIQEKLFQ